MNVPNILTVLRFLIIPFFAYFLYIQNYLVSVVLFLIAGITDVLDGYIARRFNMITSWGKFADPLADKLMQLTALLLLTIQDEIPFIVLLIVAIKELMMMIGGLIIYKYKGRVVQANWYGKAATAIFYMAVTLIIILDFTTSYNRILISIAVIATLFALLMYSHAFIKMSKNPNA